MGQRVSDLLADARSAEHGRLAALRERRQEINHPWLT
jgi:hypothetical protein